MIHPGVKLLVKKALKWLIFIAGVIVLVSVVKQEGCLFIMENL